MQVVVINGLPGVGKTPLAARIARELGWPLVTKDMIKEQLFDSLGWSDRAWSRSLSIASMDMLFLWLKTEAAAGRAVVVEGNFDCERDTQRFVAAVGPPGAQWVQVLVGCDGAVLVERHRARAAAGRRHPGHQEAALVGELTERLAVGWAVPLALPGALVRVDTTDFGLVDADAIARAVSGLIDTQ